MKTALITLTMYLAIAGSAHAKSCAYEEWDSVYPLVSQLKAYNTTCNWAGMVALAVDNRITQQNVPDGSLPVYPKRVRAYEYKELPYKTWRCSYQRTDPNDKWQRLVTCKRKNARVRMELGISLRVT